MPGSMRRIISMRARIAVEHSIQLLHGVPQITRAAIIRTQVIGRAGEKIPSLACLCVLYVVEDAVRHAEHDKGPLLPRTVFDDYPRFMDERSSREQQARNEH